MREKRKILIVDDERGVRELLSENLKMQGYETATAADGRAGLEEARRSRPNLILLDVIMPVMDGWKMLKELRADEATKSIPVVMLTAKSDTEDLFKSEGLRVSDHFIKPIDMDELLVFIKRYIDLK